MPIAEVNVRLLIIKQNAYKKVPGRYGMCSTKDELIYPDNITMTPEELFEAFEIEADPAIFEESMIPDGTTISSETHQRTFVAFHDWLMKKGFRQFRILRETLPVLEIPAQVTLINVRSPRY